MPLDRFRKFFLLFGGKNENDHPFVPVGDLNLRGYCYVIGYMRQVLEAADKVGSEGKISVSLRNVLDGLKDDDLIPLGTMTFLWLNYYLSSFPVLTQADLHVYEKYSKWIMIRGIFNHHELFDPNRPSWGTLEAMNRELEVWGMSWLLCVRFLAEATDGISSESVSAGRPARFKRWIKK